MDNYSIIWILIALGMFVTFISRGSGRVIEEQSQKTQLAKKIALGIIKRDQAKLAIQRKQMVTVDAFGKVDETKWIKNGIKPYIKKVIIDELPNDLKHTLTFAENYFFLEIKRVTDLYLKSSSNSMTYRRDFSGVEFEHFCEDEFKKRGWSVLRTKATGDQGVDLILEKKDRRIAVQCKHYSRPIGNKAVQEVVAGQSYYGTNEGVIISNNTVTLPSFGLPFPRIFKYKNSCFA